MGEEGARVAQEFARFAASLDDTMKVVSKPKEWKADDKRQLTGRDGVFR